MISKTKEKIKMSGREWCSKTEISRRKETKRRGRIEENSKNKSILFGVSGSSKITANQPDTTGSETTSIGDEMIGIKCDEKDLEKGVISICEESENMNIDDDDSVEQFSNVSNQQLEQSIETQFDFSTDVALWNVDTDLKALQ